VKAEGTNASGAPLRRFKGVAFLRDAQVDLRLALHRRHGRLASGGKSGNG
jgi:hypothetical protein